MLEYDYYKARNFEPDHWDVNIKEEDGVISWECSGGEAYFLNEENNNLIPKRYRNEFGAYYDGDMWTVIYYLTEGHYKIEKKELDLSLLLQKKRKALEAERAAEIEKINREIKKELAAYEKKARIKLRLPIK